VGREGKKKEGRGKIGTGREGRGRGKCRVPPPALE